MIKKLLFLNLLVCITSISFCQFSFGVEAGATFSNVKHMLDVKRFKSNPHTGFRFGVVSHIPLTSHLELQPALLFTQKSFEVNYDAMADPNGYSVIYSPNYLELPVNIAYMQPLTKKVSAFIGTGPALSMGVGGKSKNHGFIGDINMKGTYDMHFGREGMWNPFDLGWNVVASLQYDRAIFSLNYNHALTNHLNYDHGLQDAKTRSLAVSIAYLIKK